MFTCVLSRFSGIWLFVTLWAVVGQIFLSMGSTRQKYWSGLPFPPLGDLPDPGIEPATLRSPALAGKFFTGKLVPSGKPLKDYMLVAQSCPILREPLDCSLPGSSVHGILQARILEWVAISSSSRSSWHRDETQVFYIAGRFHTIRATREVQTVLSTMQIIIKAWILFCWNF